MTTPRARRLWLAEIQRQWEHEEREEIACECHDVLPELLEQLVRLEEELKQCRGRLGGFFHRPHPPQDETEETDP